MKATVQQRLSNTSGLVGTERAAGKDMMNLRPQARRYIRSVIIRYLLQAVFQGGGGNHRQSRQPRRPGNDSFLLHSKPGSVFLS